MVHDASHRTPLPATAKNVARGLALLSALAGSIAARAQQLDERPAAVGEWGFRPAEGGRSATNPPAFVWRPQKGDRRYAWQLSRDAEFAHVEHESRSVELPVYCPPYTLPPGTWHWRFGVVGGDGDAVRWSRVRSFELPADAVEMVLPARADLLARVPAGHPRLFLRPSDLASLRERVQGDLRPAFARLQKRCDGLLAAPPATDEPPRYPSGTVRKSEEWRRLWWGNRKATRKVLESASTLAFTGLIGGNREYRALARRLLMAAARWDPHGATGYRYNDEAGMPYAYYFARTYTWLYDDLDEDQRRLCRKVMRARGREMYRHLCPAHLWRPYSSHQNRAWHFLGEVAIAFLGEIPEAEDWLWFACNVYYTCYPVWSDEDGGWHEGLAYWRSYLSRFTWWADVMRSSLRLEPYDKPFFQHAGDWPLYLQPPGTAGGGFGDLTGRLVSADSAPLVRQLARAGHNGYWQWYADQAGPAKPVSDPISFLRAALPPVAPRPPTDLPTSKCFRGIGQAVMNTSLLSAENNVELIFKSSPFGSQSHGYEAQNSFLLYAFGERLLIRTGRRDIYGSAHHKRWMWSTRSTNAITVDGHGQHRHSAAARGAITGFATTPAFDWVEGTVDGSAYEAGMERHVRSILFAKPDFVLVVDRLRADRPRTYQWWLHAPSAFAIDGHTARVVQGRAACRIQWLRPDQLEITQTDRFDPPPRPRVHLVQHHLTARTTTPRAEAVFLTALWPHRADDEVDAAATAVAEGDGYRVRARAGGAEIEVHVGADGALQARRSAPGCDPLRASFGG